ncbi:MAG: hypothetical protein H7X97_14455 [Opitutaceae bacterium]|nr:hypothetical protein [Verrucomicrobiales bacterium]
MKTFLLSFVFAFAAHGEPAWKAVTLDDKFLRVADDNEKVVMISRDNASETKLLGFPQSIVLGSSVLKIAWEGLPDDAKTSHMAAAGMVRSVIRTADVTITRTIVAPKNGHMVLIHLLANKPGSLSFRVSGESSPKPRVENRRELLFPSPGDHGQTGWRVTVWPFEADVSPGTDSIVVRGEGEALIVWSFSRAGNPANPIPDVWPDLAKRYDPDANPPNPAKIWHGLFDAQSSAPPPTP